MARKTHGKVEAGATAKLIADKAVQIAEWAAKALVAAEQLGIKQNPVEHFWLAPAQRDVLRLVPGLSRTTKSKLTKPKPSFTVAEIAGMTMALAEELPAGEAKRQIAVMLVAQHLIERLHEGIVVSPAKPKASKGKATKAGAVTKNLLQFKLTLKETTPPIWRRIQVSDCTLDKLHEHIQTAMGWTNSHLHHFEIGGKRYGDPELLDDGFADFDCVDSTVTQISAIIPKDKKRFRFDYEYDFGDGWRHEILFEGNPPPEPGKNYPLCVEGERACPPEDVGGVWSYVEFLEALADPKHERHDELLDWSGPFDPEKFDASGATTSMSKGLPNWRA